MKPSQVSARLRRIASSIDSCSTPVRPDLVSRDLRRVLAAMDPKIVKLFRDYLRDVGAGAYADAGGFQQVLAEQGIEADVQYGPYGTVDFYELSGEVSDEFVVEEHGSDKFEVTPVT